MKPALRVALWVTLPLLIVLGLLAAWNPRGDFWGDVEPPKAQGEAYSPSQLRLLTRLTKAIYSPEKLNRLLREPQNTLSNLGYIAVGAAVLGVAARPLGRSFGVACIFLGIGSGLYHASLLPKWRMLDILGVYAVLVTLVAIGVMAVFRPAISRAREYVLASVLWLGALAAGFYRNDVRVLGIKPFDSTYIVVAAVAAGTLLALLAWRRAEQRSFYFISLAGMAGAALLAFAGGLGDRFGGFWINPQGWVQGHSVWHLGGALALLAAYEVFSAAGFDRSVRAG